MVAYLAAHDPLTELPNRARLLAASTTSCSGRAAAGRRSLSCSSTSTGSRTSTTRSGTRPETSCSWPRPPDYETAFARATCSGATAATSSSPSSPTSEPAPRRPSPSGPPTASSTASTAHSTCPAMRSGSGPASGWPCSPGTAAPRTSWCTRRTRRCTPRRTPAEDKPSSPRPDPHRPSRTRVPKPFLFDANGLSASRPVTGSVDVFCATLDCLATGLVEAVVPTGWGWCGVR